MCLTPCPARNCMFCRLLKCVFLCATCFNHSQSPVDTANSALVLHSVWVSMFSTEHHLMNRLFLETFTLVPAQITVWVVLIFSDSALLSQLQYEMQMHTGLILWSLFAYLACWSRTVVQEQWYSQALSQSCSASPTRWWHYISNIQLVLPVNSETHTNASEKQNRMTCF